MYQIFGSECLYAVMQVNPLIHLKERRMWFEQRQDEANVIRFRGRKCVAWTAEGWGEWNTIRSRQLLFVRARRTGPFTPSVCWFFFHGAPCQCLETAASSLHARVLCGSLSAQPGKIFAVQLKFTLTCCRGSAQLISTKAGNHHNHINFLYSHI
jgi:hypothetical protein